MKKPVIHPKMPFEHHKVKAVLKRNPNLRERLEDYKESKALHELIEHEKITPFNAEVVLKLVSRDAVEKVRNLLNHRLVTAENLNLVTIGALRGGIENVRLLFDSVSKEELPDYLHLISHPAVEKEDIHLVMGFAISKEVGVKNVLRLLNYPAVNSSNFGSARSIISLCGEKNFERLMRNPRVNVVNLTRLSHIGLIYEIVNGIELKQRRDKSEVISNFIFKVLDNKKAVRILDDIKIDSLTVLYELARIFPREVGGEWCSKLVPPKHMGWLGHLISEKKLSIRNFTRFLENPKITKFNLEEVLSLAGFIRRIDPVLDLLEDPRITSQNLGLISRVASHYTVANEYQKDGVKFVQQILDKKLGERELLLELEQQLKELEMKIESLFPEEEKREG